MVMNFGNYDINVHMLNHYKRVTSAKNVINTRPKSKKKNNGFKSGSVASSAHSRFSTPTNLLSGKRPESTQSSYQQEPEGNRFKQERIGSAISKKGNKRIISSIVFVEDEDHKIEDPDCLKCPENTCVSLCSQSISNTPPVKTPLPTPRSIVTDRTDRSTVPEFEYLQFSLRITEDIIRNDLYTNKEMQRVFNSHIEANRGRLSMKRMLEQINLLCKELNIGKDSKNQNSFKFSNNGSKKLVKNHENGDETCTNTKIVDQILSDKKLLTDDEIQNMDEYEIQEFINKLLNNSSDTDSDKKSLKNENIFSLDCGDLLRSPEMTVEEFLNDSESDNSTKKKIIKHDLFKSSDTKQNKFNFDKYITLNFQKMGIDVSVQTSLDKSQEDCMYNLDKKENNILMDGIVLENQQPEEKTQSSQRNGNEIPKNIEVLKPLTTNYNKSSLDNVSLHFSDNISDTINIKPFPIKKQKRILTPKDKIIRSASNISPKKVTIFTKDTKSTKFGEVNKNKNPNPSPQLSTSQNQSPKNAPNLPSVQERNAQADKKTEPFQKNPSKEDGGHFVSEISVCEALEEYLTQNEPKKSNLDTNHSLNESFQFQTLPISEDLNLNLDYLSSENDPPVPSISVNLIPKGSPVPSESGSYDNKDLKEKQSEFRYPSFLNLTLPSSEYDILGPKFINYLSPIAEEDLGIFESDSESKNHSSGSNVSNKKDCTENSSDTSQKLPFLYDSNSTLELKMSHLSNSVKDEPQSVDDTATDSSTSDAKLSNILTESFCNFIENRDSQTEINTQNISRAVDVDITNEKFVEIDSNSHNLPLIESSSIINTSESIETIVKSVMSPKNFDYDSPTSCDFEVSSSISCSDSENTSKTLLNSNCDLESPKCINSDDETVVKSPEQVMTSQNLEEEEKTFSSVENLRYLFGQNDDFFRFDSKFLFLTQKMMRVC